MENRITNEQAIMIIEKTISLYEDREMLNKFFTGYSTYYTTDMSEYSTVKCLGMCALLGKAAYDLGILIGANPVKVIRGILIQKPKTGWRYHTAFWWKPDNVNIRVKCLRKALEYHKSKRSTVTGGIPRGMGIGCSPGKGLA